MRNKLGWPQLVGRPSDLFSMRSETEEGVEMDAANKSVRATPTLGAIEMTGTVC
jgi:hypothetical protein